MTKITQALKVLHQLLSSQFGIDPFRLVRALSGLPGFVRDWRKFRGSNFHGSIALKPCLHDRFQEGGSTKSEYFWQDLLVAQWIHRAGPDRHVDVGSRFDGFVAHVASFREIEVFDVRPMTSQVPGVVFRRANLMDASSLPADMDAGYCDSLSCLHVLEHFGLGRYGDPVDPRGYEAGFANLARLLRPRGTLYLSTPIGRERVEFNANWVFDPGTILRLAESNRLILRNLTVVREGSTFAVVKPNRTNLVELSSAHYNLGIFTFDKMPADRLQLELDELQSTETYDGERALRALSQVSEPFQRGE